MGSVMAETRGHDDGARCLNHRRYKLSCDQYDDLLKRSGGVCEICRRPLARTRGSRLAIDHLGPFWAVRGLLCNGCNGLLQDDRADFRTAAEYLASAWWEQQCSALGFPLTIRPEPPVGSAIRNQYGVIWVHLREGAWEAGTQDGHHWTRQSWRDLFDSYGPHNLIPYDLPAAFKDRSAPLDLRWTVENKEGWEGVRLIVGAPEPVARRPEARACDWSPRDSLPWLRTPEETAKALSYFLTPGECARVAQLLLAPEVPEVPS
jgi:hypothetical protein